MSEGESIVRQIANAHRHSPTPLDYPFSVLKALAQEVVALRERVDYLDREDERP